MATTTATPSIPTGLKGKLTKKNFGPSMPSYAPTYPALDPEGWDWLDIDLVMVDYLTNAEAAAEWLPAQCDLVQIPTAPGQSAVKVIFANYRGGTLPPYKEVVQNIPCIYKGQIFLYVAQIWVDTDSGMTSGREIGGYPKPIGSGNRIASCTFQKTGRMVSLPLPANRKPVFPFPYNLTMPLPEPTGKPQGLPFSTLGIRLVPNGGASGKEDAWALAQITGNTWTLEKGVLWAGEASLSFRASELDPLHKLPVNMVLDAMLFQGDMSGGAPFADPL
jgi:acetoacetate decarboxylase